ncbi:MAG TPA: TIGR02996 domain-containing protein, partial [Gemmataceae bacterium]
MSDRDAFLRAICASPDDDTPRLVFADWLEERGTAAEVAWAEFIRLQCEAERLPPEDERVGDLEFRAEGLAAAFEREWLGEWAERLVNWSFRRGFLDGVVIEPRPFLRYGGSLFERHPLLRRVRFVGPDGRGVPDEAVGELAALPHLARVRALDLSGDRTDGPAWARALARATHLTGLEELDLSETSPDGRGALDPGDLRRLADAPHLGSLRRLRIGTVYSEALGPDAINRIAAAPFARHLEALNLDGHGIGDEGCRRLARNPVFQGLRSLSLDRAQRITQAGVRDLIESPHLDRLTHLNIAGVQLDVPELARLPGLARLERLG